MYIALTEKEQVLFIKLLRQIADMDYKFLSEKDYYPMAADLELNNISVSDRAIRFTKVMELIELLGKSPRSMADYLDIKSEAALFLNRVRLAHIEVGGDGIIPEELSKWVEGCYQNGIRFQVYVEKKRCLRRNPELLEEKINEN